MRPTTARKECMLIAAKKVPLIRSMLMTEYPDNLKGMLAKSIKVFYRNLLYALVGDSEDIYVNIPTGQLGEDDMSLLEHMLKNSGWSVAERDRDYYKVIPKTAAASEEQLIMQGLLCPYCHTATRLIEGFWECPSCLARVECHPGTTAAMGFVANEALRKQRHQVHEVMDQLWLTGGLKRSDVYYKLRQQMNLTKAQCHVAKFNEEQCKQALKCLKTIEDSINNEQTNSSGSGKDPEESGR